MVLTVKNGGAAVGISGSEDKTEDIDGAKDTKTNTPDKGGRTTAAGRPAVTARPAVTKKATPGRLRREGYEVGEAAGEAGEAGTVAAALEVKVKNKKKLDLGGLDMHLSDQVRVDGVWTTMPTGYPKIDVKGKAVSFTFRFARFAKAAQYDPLMSTSGAASVTSPEVRYMR